MKSSNQILDSNLIFNMMPLKSKQDFLLVQDLLMKQIENSMQLCKSIFMPIQSKIININQQNKNRNNKQNVSEVYQQKNNFEFELDTSIFMQLQTKFSQLKSVLQKVCCKAAQMQTIQQQKTHYQEKYQLNKQQEYFLQHILCQVGLITQKIIIENQFSEVIKLAKLKYQKLNSRNYLMKFQSTVDKCHQQKRYSKKQNRQNDFITQREQLQLTKQSEQGFIESKSGERDHTVYDQSMMDIRGYTQIKPQNSVINKLNQSENQVKNIIKNWEKNIKLQN